MTDADRTLVVAAALSAMSAAAWAWRVRGLDPSGPARRVAELRTANGAALLVAALGAAGLAFGYDSATPSLAAAAVAGGLACLILGAVLLHLEPAVSLRLGAFALLSVTLAAGIVTVRAGAAGAAPMLRPVHIGMALYAGYMGALCVFVRRP